MSDLAFAARHSMDSPEWYTPSPFIEAAREVMGGIDLDPMSHEEANRIVKADNFYTEADDCFTQEWFGRVFLNPSGGLVGRAWKRLVYEVAHENVQQAIWIGYSLEQLQTLQQETERTPNNFPICITKARIAFIENEAKKALRIAKLLAEGEAPGAAERKRKIAASIRAGKEPPNSPSHSNYVSFLGPNAQEFERLFSRFGQVRR